MSLIVVTFMFVIFQKFFTICWKFLVIIFLCYAHSKRAKFEDRLWMTEVEKDFVSEPGKFSAERAWEPKGYFWRVIFCSLSVDCKIMSWYILVSLCESVWMLTEKVQRFIRTAIQSRIQEKIYGKCSIHFCLLVLLNDVKHMELWMCWWEHKNEFREICSKSRNKHQNKYLAKDWSWAYNPSDDGGESKGRE